MQKLHLAIAVKKLDSAIAEYSQRLGCEPVTVANRRYALWRTKSLNFSISQISEKAGQLRHLGFESPDIPKMFSDQDVNGIEWEYFTAEQQRQEIIKHYPDIDHPETAMSKCLS